jgi:phosphopantothenoylcysteine decarboxylase/phosphopantothenate--cysteine ligase
MACGEFGPGRMAEPDEILAAIERLLTAETRLSGLKALVTAGPTYEPIDPVRYIANRSSGKQGYAIASALANAGADTVLISGPVEISPPRGVKLIKVQTARQMWDASQAELPADIAVCAAAVADWRTETTAPVKLKKRNTAPTLALVENPDILASLGTHASLRPKLVIGFAAETDELIANATAKRAAKGSDWIVANDISGNVMGGDSNRVHLVTASGVESWPELPKHEVGRRLADRIADAFGKKVA